MHPIVLQLATEAARGAGEEIGKAIAAKLFGGGSNNAALQKQMAEIISRLKIIEKKVDHLTRLVEQLPEILLAQLELTLADEAYRYLESSEEVWLGANPGQIKPPGDDVAMLKAWKTVVDLESRSGRLLELIHWTEYLRKRFRATYDESFATRLSLKLHYITNVFSSAASALDREFAVAEQLLTGPFFRNPKVTATAPYVSYELASAPLVWVDVKYVPDFEIEMEKLNIFPGGDGPGGRETGSAGDRRRRVPDPAFVAEQTRRKRQLESLQKTLETRAAALQAVTPAKVALESYIPLLKKKGLVPADKLLV